MTTITIPTFLVWLTYGLIGLEVFRIRGTVYKVAKAIAVLAIRIVVIVGKPTYRFAKRTARRFRRYARKQAAIFAHYYPNTATGKFRAGRRAHVPGPWLEKVLIGVTVLVVGVSQIV